MNTEDTTFLIDYIQREIRRLNKILEGYNTTLQKNEDALTRAQSNGKYADTPTLKRLIEKETGEVTTTILNTMTMKKDVTVKITRLEEVLAKLDQTV